MSVSSLAADNGADSNVLLTYEALYQLIYLCEPEKRLSAVS